MCEWDVTYKLCSNCRKREEKNTCISLLNVLALILNSDVTIIEILIDCDNGNRIEMTQPRCDFRFYS